MAEDLTKYLTELGVKTTYMHSDIDTIERMKIIRELRLGEYDVLVGINLLREGLDIPEVALVAILDADKEGFLRSETSLIQTIGRAARNSESKVIMYADTITKSIDKALKETERRRVIQKKYNEEHGIVPTTIIKEVRDVIEATKVAEEIEEYKVDKDKKLTKKEKDKLIKEYTEEMMLAAKNLQFERAAELRDIINGLKNWQLKINLEYRISNYEQNIEWYLNKNVFWEILKEFNHITVSCYLLTVNWIEEV